MKRTISVFLGSIRPGRQGEKVTDWLINALKQRGYKTYLIDPLKYEELQTLAESYKYSSKPSEEIIQIHQWLEESDGFILVTPEYNRSSSGTIKNAIDHFFDEYTRKPFGIISYSIRPTGGVRANDALKLVIPELKGILTPASVMIPAVHEAFDDKGIMKDPKYDEYLKTFLEDFEWYLDALKDAREKKR